MDSFLVNLSKPRVANSGSGTSERKVQKKKKKKKETYNSYERYVTNVPNPIASRYKDVTKQWQKRDVEQDFRDSEASLDGLSGFSSSRSAYASSSPSPSLPYENGGGYGAHRAFTMNSAMREAFKSPGFASFRGGVEASELQQELSEHMNRLRETFLVGSETGHRTLQTGKSAETDRKTTEKKKKKKEKASSSKLTSKRRPATADRDEYSGYVRNFGLQYDEAVKKKAVIDTFCKPDSSDTKEITKKKVKKQRSNVRQTTSRPTSSLPSFRELEISQNIMKQSSPPRISSAKGEGGGAKNRPSSSHASRRATNLYFTGSASNSSNNADSPKSPGWKTTRSAKTAREREGPSLVGRYQEAYRATHNNGKEGQKKYFVQGHYPNVKKLLKEFDYEEGLCSMYSNLIWTEYDKDVKYQQLKPGQLVNHFENNEVLTTKAGLCKSLDSLAWSQSVDVNTFYPRAYDLSHNSGSQAFIEDYQQTVAESLVRDFAANEYRGSLRLLETAIEMCMIKVDTLTGDDAALDESTQSVQLTERDRRALATYPSLQKEEGGSLLNIDDSDVEEDLRKRVEAVIAFLDQEDYQWNINGRKNIWIVKPTSSSSGVGIRCTDNLQEIVENRSAKVVQKYIENPLLVGGKKFDIRQWVLVTSWNPLVVWFYDECIIRFSGENFVLGDLKNHFVHLCNYAIQKKRVTKTEQKESVMWTSDQLKTWLGQEHGDPEIWNRHIRPILEKIVLWTIQAGTENIVHRDGSFELYGFDLMLDEFLNPWLMEVNCSPNLRASTPAKTELVSEMLRDLFNVVFTEKPDETRPKVRENGAFQDSPQERATKGKDSARPQRLGVGSRIGLWKLIHRDENRVETPAVKPMNFMLEGRKVSAKEVRASDRVIESVSKAAESRHEAAKTIQTAFRRRLSTTTSNSSATEEYFAVDQGDGDYDDDVEGHWSENDEEILSSEAEQDFLGISGALSPTVMDPSLPEDVTTWSEENVCRWLEVAGFSQYTSVFKENNISGRVMFRLTLDLLKDLGINSLGHRETIVERIQLLKD